MPAIVFARAAGLPSIAPIRADCQSSVSGLKLLMSGSTRRSGRRSLTKSSTSWRRAGLFSIRLPFSSPRWSHSGTSTSMRPMFCLSEVKLVSSQLTKNA
jgi:hypothetical protein